MLIRLAKRSDVKSSEITPKALYLNRRSLICPCLLNFTQHFQLRLSACNFLRFYIGSVFL